MMAKAACLLAQAAALRTSRGDRMELQEGLIRKGIGGFYYVEAAGGEIVECRARGIFRKNGISPAAGDRISFSVSPEDGSGTVVEIHPRRNYFVRPPVANIDQLFIIASVCDPSPSTLIIDKTIAAAENKGVEPIVVATKTDLQSSDSLKEIYHLAGIRFLAVSSETGEGVEEIRTLLRGKISAFTGNSGVGKSTLLNCVDDRFSLQTGETSRKLGRGRHTTRQVELLALEGGGYVADTPGFSTMDLERYEIILKEDLPRCFREFAQYIPSCRFPSCSHTCEKGCAVLEAVREGKIHPSRHASYVAMYQEVKDVKQWQKK